MIIYRPHRGSLREAMLEAREFENEELMKEHIVKHWNGLIYMEDIVIDDITIDDDRNGWKDTRYVCTRRMGNEDYIKLYGKPQCIGHCATYYR